MESTKEKTENFILEDWVLYPKLNNMQLIRNIIDEGHILERTDGKEIFENPFYYVNILSWDRALVVQKHEYFRCNIVNIEGKYVFNKWFDRYRRVDNDNYIIIHVNNKGWNIVNRSNKLMLDVWCYDIQYYKEWYFRCQTIKGNNFFIDKKGNLHYMTI